MDWLASGLLRRIALYRTFGLAFHVSAWTSGNTWKIEIDTDPVHGAVHNRFLAAIAMIPRLVPYFVMKLAPRTLFMALMVLSGTALVTTLPRWGPVRPAALPKKVEPPPRGAEMLTRSGARWTEGCSM
jgi:hypothetical protein